MVHTVRNVSLKNTVGTVFQNIIFIMFFCKKAEEVHRNNNSIDIKELDIKDYPKGNKLVDVNSYLSGDVFVNKKEIKKF